MVNTHAVRNNWTPERLTITRQLWEDGLSAAQIASVFNKAAGTHIFSRSAILGKVHRLKWPQRARGGQYQHNNKPRAKQRKTQQRREPLKRVLREEPVVKAPKLPHEPLPPPVLAEMKRVPFLDRGISECSFIIEGAGMNAVCCGNHALRGRMCGHHQRFCHIAGSARRPKDTYTWRP